MAKPHRGERGPGGAALQMAILALALAGSITSAPLAAAAASVSPRVPGVAKAASLRDSAEGAVIAASPLAPGLSHYLARQTGLPELPCSKATGKPRWLWSAMIRNTHLDGKSVSAVPELWGAAGTAQIVIDPSGSVSLPSAQEVWRFENAAGAALFTPFMQSDTWHRPPYVAHVRLVRYEPGTREGALIAEACIGTRVPFRTMANALAEVAALQLRDALAHPPSPKPAQATEAGWRRRGSVAQLAGGWTRYQARRWTSRLYSEFWCVGIVRQPLPALLAAEKIGEIRWLDDGSRTAYLADPFALPGGDLVLCEEYPYHVGVGRIVKLDPSTGARQPFDLCGAISHRSYPYTWTEAGEVFLLPESSEDRQSTLYKLGPDGSVSVAAVIGHGTRMADPTIFRADGLYWIAFADLDIAEGANLSLLYADSLLGPWHPHPRNPVKIDVRSSRPAGTPFWSEGTLYRPAQDCSRTYGWGVAINRVVDVSPSRYVEVTERWFHPDPGSPFSDGLHTLAAAGDYTLIDGKRLTIRSTVLLKKLARRFGLPMPGLPMPGGTSGDGLRINPGYSAAALRAEVLPDASGRPPAELPT